MKNKTIAIDFDGVIHKYSFGWQGGDIYDAPVLGAIQTINTLLSQGYSVFILSTRNSRQIKKWLKTYSNYLLYMSQSDFMDQFYPFQKMDDLIIKSEQSFDKLQYKMKVIPFWKEFWNEKNVLGITNRKLAAECYIDDRAVCFNGNWDQTTQDILNFKTYQSK